MSPLPRCFYFSQCRCEDSTWRFWNHLQKALQALANAEGWIKGSPSPMIIWLSDGRSRCRLAEVTFRATTWESQIRDYEAFSFQFLCCPLTIVCKDSKLIVMFFCPFFFFFFLNDCLPVSTVSGLKKEKKSMFSKDTLARHLQHKGGFHKHLNPWQWWLRAVLETRSIGARTQITKERRRGLLFKYPDKRRP